MDVDGQFPDSKLYLWSNTVNVGLVLIHSVIKRYVSLRHRDDVKIDVNFRPDEI